MFKVGDTVILQTKTYYGNRTAEKGTVCIVIGKHECGCGNETQYIVQLPSGDGMVVLRENLIKAQG
jgi:hypothetical protein